MVNRAPMDGDEGDGSDAEEAPDVDLMGLVQDTLGPMLGGVLGGNVKMVLRGVDVALNTVFRLVGEAYEQDAEEAQAILTSDARAIEKVSRLNGLVLDGADADGEESDDVGE